MTWACRSGLAVFMLWWRKTPKYQRPNTAEVLLTPRHPHPHIRPGGVVWAWWSTSISSPRKLSRGHHCPLTWELDPQDQRLYAPPLSLEGTHCLPLPGWEFRARMQPGDHLEGACDWTKSPLDTVRFRPRCADVLILRHLVGDPLV